MKKLDNFTTKELVDELTKRAGVEIIIAEPYQDIKVERNGPAIILVITD